MSTGRSHPALEGWQPLHGAFQWLQDAYFRLHNRRQRSDYGMAQPIRHEDMAALGTHGLRLSESMMPFFIRVMENTDNEVLRVLGEKRAKSGK